MLRGSSTTLWFSLVNSTPFYICMPVNKCVYLQKINYFSCDIILCILTGILSLEGKNSVSHGKAKLRSHRCLLWCACIYAKLLDSCKGYRTFLAVTVEPQPCKRIVTNLKVMYYRNLSN